MLAEARDTANLALAGLGHRRWEGVLALAGDDDVNLDVAMTSALLRLGLRVIARTHSRQIATQMEAFGHPQIINPLDRFGNHLRIRIRSPAAYQLIMWLTALRGPGPASPRSSASWTADLRAEGLELTVVEDAPRR